MFDRLLDSLALLGLTVRARHTSETGFPAREWGPAIDGFSLSIAARDMNALSIALRNVSREPRQIAVPGWASFYRTAVLKPGGVEAPLTAFGRECVNVTVGIAPVRILLAAGESSHTEIPLSALYQVREPGEYRITVSCPVPGPAAGSVLTSNELRVSQPG